MSDQSSIPRPLMVVRAPAATESTRGRGGSKKTGKPSRERQGERLDQGFSELQRLLDSDQSRPVGGGLVAADPELVVVFEIIEESLDLAEAFTRVGLDLMLDVEDSITDEALGEDFARTKTARPGSDPVKRYLHAAMANDAALRQLISLWNKWKTGDRMASGFGPYTQLFARLHNVRPWGPADRVRSTGLDESLRHALDGAIVELPVTIEMFFRQSEALRRRAEERVQRIVLDAGGRVLRTVEHPQIGYHAIAAVIPPESLDASSLDVDEIALLNAPGVIFVRPGGQGTSVQLAPDLPGASPPPTVLPLGPPLVAILDGLPESNHPLLQDRLAVLDPDDIASDATYTTDRRRHGTMVASAVIWGDLGRGSAPATRTVLARPVMRPDSATMRFDESIPWDELPPDVTIRAVEEIVAQAPSVRVINMSLGDPLAQFDTIPSAWARAVDWLAYEYNLLFVVSAGNHTINLPIDAATLNGLPDDERDRLTSQAIAGQSPARRLLSPSESLNAVTVGAIHDDGAGSGYQLGYRHDVWSGPGHPSPISAHGRGIRRAMKPDVAVPGGRQLYDEIVGAGELAISHGQARPPGVQVAAPPDRTMFVSGTTFAAAEVSRMAADIVSSLATISPVDDSFTAVATKALLAHGAELPSSDYVIPTDLLTGYGVVVRDLAIGCASTQATVLFVGQLAAQQETELTVPLPVEVGGRAIRKRVTTTLAWLSPVNWNHRQYRRAKLTIDGPAGIDGRSNSGAGYHESRRGTLEHHVFETDRAYAATGLTFSVKCLDQAGGFVKPINFAAAISIEVPVEAGVDIYSLVRAQLSTRVRL